MIVLNQLLRRARRRITLAVLLAPLVLALAAHHSELAVDHATTGAIVTLCLAVVTVAAVLSGPPARPSRALVRLVVPTSPPAEPLAAGAFAPRARAGPPALQVFLN
jgi:hypothetical protein